MVFNPYMQNASKLQTLKIKGGKSLRVSAQFVNEVVTFNRPNGPDARQYIPTKAKELEMFKNMPKDVLHWRVVTDVAVKELPKAVLRNSLKYRWKYAIREALASSGYSPEGRKLDSKERGVVGTLELLDFGPGFHAKYSELLEHATKIVKEIELKQPSSPTKAPNVVNREHLPGSSADSMSPFNKTPDTIAPYKIAPSGRIYLRREEVYGSNPPST